MWQKCVLIEIGCFKLRCVMNFKTLQTICGYQSVKFGFAVLFMSFGLISQAIAQDETASDIAANICLLYTSPSPRDQRGSRMPSSA